MSGIGNQPPPLGGPGEINPSEGSDKKKSRPSSSPKLPSEDTVRKRLEEKPSEGTGKALEDKPYIHAKASTQEFMKSASNSDLDKKIKETKTEQILEGLKQLKSQ